ncbi:MAG TPA: hypothetical protein VGJ94_12455 [Syntrophorhabdaceae bacterium]
MKTDSFGLKVGAGKALDFGCGAGRLTLGLSQYSDHACGADIALSMIDRNAIPLLAAPAGEGTRKPEKP